MSQDSSGDGVATPNTGESWRPTCNREAACTGDPNAVDANAIKSVAHSNNRVALCENDDAESIVDTAAALQRVAGCVGLLDAKSTGTAVMSSKVRR